MLQGDIKELAIEDVFQVMRINTMPAKLMIKDDSGETRAKVYFRDGLILFAQFYNGEYLINKDALYEILQIKTGKFEVHFNAPMPVTNLLYMGIETALLNIAKKIDEKSNGIS